MKTVVKQPQTILDALLELAPGSSKTSRKAWIQQQRVLLNQAVAGPKSFAAEGDTLVLLSKEQTVDGLRIYYKDSHIVVVEKPEGLLSVDADKKFHSLHKILKQKYGFVWPVQRLDKETSGVMVFALSNEAKEGLKLQFSKHTVVREYYAIVEGKLLKDSGTWKHKLIDCKDFVVRPSANGVLTVTHYEVVKRSDKESHLLLKLKTGKKNQIRVHASLAGHPVLGDRKYGSENFSRGRLALHAQKLGFVHPVKGKKLEFFSPKPFR